MYINKQINLYKLERKQSFQQSFNVNQHHRIMIKIEGHLRHLPVLNTKCFFQVKQNI